MNKRTSLIMAVKSFCGLIGFCLFMFACASGTQGERGLAVEELPQVEADIRVFPQVPGIVYSGKFSPDGLFAITGDYSGAVKVWEVETGVLVRSYYGHEGPVMSVAWSPDGKYIASGSKDKTVKIWDTAGYFSEVRESLTLNNTGEVWSVSFSPDSRLLVAGGSVGDGKPFVSVWDIESGGETRVRSGHRDRVFSVAFSPDGKRIVSASGDATVRVCDAVTGELIHAYTGHRDTVRSVAWAPDGKFLVSASFDMTVRIWNIETNAVRVIGSEVYDFEVNDAQFSPDGKRIATAGGSRGTKTGRDIILWDTATGAEIRRFSEHVNRVGSVNWEPGGRFIVTASDDTTAKIYDAENGRCLQTFAGKTDALWSAALSGDGKRIVTGSEGSKVNIWNAETGVLEHSLEHSGERIYGLAVSPDFRLVAAGSLDRNDKNDELKIWDMETGNELRKLEGHNNSVLALAFNPVNGLLASASADIRIWDPDTGRQMAVLSEHKGAVESLAFSADGRLLVSGSRDKTVRVWESADSETGQYRLLHTLTGHSDDVTSVAVSSDGKRAVSGSRDKTVRVWDTETGEDISWISCGTDVYSIALNPDGRSVCMGDLAVIRNLEINDRGTIRKSKVEKQLQDIARSLCYSSDGKRIFAGISDGTARIYNAEDLTEIACFVYFTGEDAQTVSTGRGLTVEAKQTVSQIDGDWLSITPDGYYKGSIRGDRFINVLINNRDLTTMDAYSDIFHKPEVVQARLLGQPDPVDTKISIQQAASFRPPVVTIQSPVTGTTVTGEGTVSLSVNITDRNQPIKDIRILVNGVRIGSEELMAVSGTNGITVEEGGLSVSGNQKTVQFIVPVSLVESGSNRIEVMAHNGYSWGYSGDTRNVSVNWLPSPGMQVPLPNLWILAIGVNKYDHEKIPDLNFCDNDARRLVDSFKAQEGRRYGTVNYRLLVDGEVEPTAANVRTNLSFLEQAGQRDVVLMFLAGHGISEGDRFYFLTKDAVIDGNKVDPNRAITDDALKQVLNAPGRRMIFIDACQSGGMDIDGFMFSLRRTNAYMLSSSEGNRPSYEDDPRSPTWDRHGVFTYSVIRGLNGMARPRNDASISVLQLSGYVRNAVMDFTIDKPYQQRPVQYSWGFSDFDIAR